MSDTVPQNVSTAELYPQIQQFYAGQVRHLDGMRAAGLAATFAADGVFDRAPGARPLHGRQAIIEEIREDGRLLTKSRKISPDRAV